MNGADISVSVGKQALVFLSAATFFSYFKYLGNNTERAMGAALGFAGLAESGVMVADATVLNQEMERCTMQLNILRDELNRMNKLPSSGRAQDIISSRRDSLVSQIERTKGEFEYLNKMRLTGPLISNSTGKHIVVSLLTASTALLTYSPKANIYGVAAASLASLTVGEGVVVYVDTMAVDSAINSLEMELAQLQSELFNLEYQ